VLRFAVLLLVAAISTAQAADTTLTLACQGTHRSDAAWSDAGTTVSQINIGVIIDFQNKTVTLGNDLLNIRSANEATIWFGLEGGAGDALLSIMDGTIDRVTGALTAASRTTDPKTRGTILSVSWDLQCRPTQRMF
jgi:hypothetical protein